MVDQIWHLDLLLQLQGEMFAGLLQDIISFSHCNFYCFIVLVFVWSFHGYYVTDNVLNTWYLFRNGHEWTSVQWNPFWWCLPMRNAPKRQLLWKRYVMDLWVPN